MKHRILALAAALVCMAGLAQAATLRIEASGTISIVGSDFDTDFDVGQSASLIWDIDTSVAASSTGPDDAFYPATTFISMTFNDQTYSDSFLGNSIGVTDADFFSVNLLNGQASAFDITFAGVSGLKYQVFLNGTDDFVTGTSLTQSFDPAEVTSSFFRLVDGDGLSKNLTATFTTATFTTAPIPVPAALPLLLTALGGLGLLHRRRRNLAA